MDHEIKTIIFDLGGVIVGSFGKELVEYASGKLGIEQEELRTLMNKHEPDLQTGKITHVEFWKKVLKDKNLPESSEEILASLWLDPYKEHAHINQEMINLADKLRSKYIVGVISNAQEPHNSYNQKRGLFEHFSPLVLSSEVGLRKPEKEIFELYLEKTKCKPQEAVFIDDEEKLLINARQLGIHIIHFQNTEQLKQELSFLGVVV